MITSQIMIEGEKTFNPEVQELRSALSKFARCLTTKITEHFHQDL